MNKDNIQSERQHEEGRLRTKVRPSFTVALASLTSPCLGSCSNKLYVHFTLLRRVSGKVEVLA